VIGFSLHGDRKRLDVRALDAEEGAGGRRRMSGWAGPLDKRLFSDGLLNPAANREI